MLLPLGFAAPASAQVSLAEGEDLIQLQVGDRLLELTLTRDFVRGPGVLLSRGADALVGHIPGAVVNLGWSEGPIIGRVGEEEVQLIVSERSPSMGLLLEGDFASWPTELIVAPITINGAVAGCDYAITLAGARYEGWRTCRAGITRVPSPVTLVLPEALRSFDDRETVALLALLLSLEMLPPERALGPGGGRTLEGPAQEEAPPSR
jgi:hypothetical protein